MKKTANLELVLEILKKEGYNDEQITQFIADLTKLGFEKLYIQSASLFTNEDLDKIDQAQKHEVDGVIRHLYRERVGKDPEKEVAEIINTFCEGFLNEYKGAAKN